MFKIRNIEGLFSTGGTYPSFNKKGKTWTQRGHITSHLSQLREYEKKAMYAGCTVVEFEMIEVGEVSEVLDWQPLPSTVRAKELEEQRRLEREKEYKLRQIAKLEEQLKRMKK